MEPLYFTHTAHNTNTSTGAQVMVRTTERSAKVTSNKEQGSDLRQTYDVAVLILFEITLTRKYGVVPMAFDCLAPRAQLSRCLCSSVL
jgi:hypothetical protein